MTNRYTPELKKHHVDQWRASGLTRRQYCESQGINPGAFKHWTSQVKATQGSIDTLPSIMPIHITPPSAPEPLTEPVILYLPCGHRIACQPAQLSRVFQALKYAEA